MVKALLIATSFISITLPIAFGEPAPLPTQPLKLEEPVTLADARKLIFTELREHNAKIKEAGLAAFPSVFEIFPNELPARMGMQLFRTENGTSFDMPVFAIKSRRVEYFGEYESVYLTDLAQDGISEIILINSEGSGILRQAIYVLYPHEATYVLTYVFGSINNPHCIQEETPGTVKILPGHFKHLSKEVASLPDGSCKSKPSDGDSFTAVSYNPLRGRYEASSGGGDYIHKKFYEHTPTNHIDLGSK